MMKTKSDFGSRNFSFRRIAAVVAGATAGILAMLSFAQTTTTSSTATPGLPRFFIYMSPQGVADDAGEPSIGSNWTREATNHNHNVDGSVNDILNGGKSLYFGGFLDAMAKVTWDDCSSPAFALWEIKVFVSAHTPRAFTDAVLFTDNHQGRTFVVL